MAVSGPTDYVWAVIFTKCQLSIDSKHTHGIVHLTATELLGVGVVVVVGVAVKYTP